MSTVTELGRRIAELRRRHFGSRGRGEFARRLQVGEDEYARYERGRVPPGDVLVRMCEVTGEDLQWLLTGVAGRGTMVISGARDRHQRLIESIARLLERSPDSAGPIEAFVALLAQGAQAADARTPRLPEPTAGVLIPILDDGELPALLPPADGPQKGRRLPVPAASSRPIAERAVHVVEPDARSGHGRGTAARIVTLAEPAGVSRDCVDAPAIARCFPEMFGLRIADGAMAPLFQPGDVTLVSPAAGPRVGRPAVCRIADRPGVLCRVWLGESGGQALLGRLSDGGEDIVPTAELRWSLEALYRVRPAA